CCRSFVDLRRRLSPAIDNEKLGSFASAVSTFHNITPHTEFWQLAREVKQKVKKAINHGDMFNIILMFTEVLNALLSSSHKAPLAVEVTNLGQVDIPVNYGSLKLEEISFMPSQGVFGGVFFAAVTTLKDKMMLNFVFSEPSLSQATVEDLKNNTMSYLIRSFQ
ncbi:MAG: alcohol acetyltransferase, partial [Cyanobacteria bacterium P01_D01_bin.116]